MGGRVAVHTLAYVDGQPNLGHDHAQIAQSTYYAVNTRAPSQRDLRDQELSGKIRRIHEANYGVYGVGKIRAVLQREGEQVAESTVRRLGLRAVSRAKSPRTTRPAPSRSWPASIRRPSGRCTRPRPGCARSCWSSTPRP